MSPHAFGDVALAATQAGICQVGVEDRATDWQPRPTLTADEFPDKSPRGNARDIERERERDNRRPTCGGTSEVTVRALVHNRSWTEHTSQILHQDPPPTISGCILKHAAI